MREQLRLCAMAQVLNADSIVFAWQEVTQFYGLLQLSGKVGFRSPEDKEAAQVGALKILLLDQV